MRISSKVKEARILFKKSEKDANIYKRFYKKCEFRFKIPEKTRFLKNGRCKNWKFIKNRRKYVIIEKIPWTKYKFWETIFKNCEFRLEVVKKQISSEGREQTRISKRITDKMQIRPKDVSKTQISPKYHEKRHVLSKESVKNTNLL